VEVVPPLVLPKAFLLVPPEVEPEQKEILVLELLEQQTLVVVAAVVTGSRLGLLGLVALAWSFLGIHRPSPLVLVLV
jgi:hypothetical protein